MCRWRRRTPGNRRTNYDPQKTNAPTSTPDELWPILGDDRSSSGVVVDLDPQPGLAHPLAGPPATAGRLDRALQHHARAHSRPSSRPRASPTPCTRRPGWTLVGTTKGRGRYDRHARRDQPKKDIWLRPLAEGLAAHSSTGEIMVLRHLSLPFIPSRPPNDGSALRHGHHF